MRFPILALGLLAVVSMSAEAQEAELPVDTVQRNVGVLRPGDMIRMVVFRNEEYSGEYLIDNRGVAHIPGMGPLQVADRSPTEVGDLVRRYLAENLGFVDADVSVQALVRIQVLGEVQNQGIQLVPPGSTLLELLTTAGGPTPAANLSRTRVIRDGRVYPVDVESALRGSAAGRVILYSNDVVVVPRSTGLFTRENLMFAFSIVSVALTTITLFRSF